MSVFTVHRGLRWAAVVLPQRATRGSLPSEQNKARFIRFLEATIAWQFLEPGASSEHAVSLLPLCGALPGTLRKDAGVGL